MKGRHIPIWLTYRHHSQWRQTFIAGTPNLCILGGHLGNARGLILVVLIKFSVPVFLLLVQGLTFLLTVHKWILVLHCMLVSRPGLESKKLLFFCKPVKIL